MFTLILLVILGLVFGYFATQNTQTITISLAHYMVTDIPLYVAVGITLLIGLSLSWLLSLLDSLSFVMKLRGKDSTIKDSKKNIQELTKRINQLELENAVLKGKKEQKKEDETA